MPLFRGRRHRRPPRQRIRFLSPDRRYPHRLRSRLDRPLHRLRRLRRFQRLKSSGARVNATLTGHLPHLCHGRLCRRPHQHRRVQALSRREWSAGCCARCSIPRHSRLSTTLALMPTHHPPSRMIPPMVTGSTLASLAQFSLLEPTKYQQGADWRQHHLQFSSITYIVNKYICFHC